MTLETDGQSPTTPETTSAPPPEAKAPEAKLPDILKEKPNEAEQIATAERDELRKVYRKLQAERAEEAEPDEPKTPEAKRGPDGKFVALKETVDTGDDEAAEKPPVAKEAKKEPAPKEPEPRKPAIEPPKHWDDKRKAALAKLEPDEQEAFVKEFGELHKTATNHGRALKSLEPVVKVLQEHKALFEKSGVSYDQGVAALLRAHAALENPATSRDAILQLARQYNVDLGTPQTQQQDAEDEWVDPNVQKLAQELAQERERNNRIEQYLHGFAQQQKMQVAQAKEASLLGLIDQFAQGKDDFADLAEDITTRAQMIMAVNRQMPPDQVLAKAYHEARLLSPATQEKVLAEREREKAAKAEQARRAAALNVSSEPDPSLATSEREQMRAVYRRNHAA